MKISAVIPAKGESTRLKNKNLYRINGRSLVERACERMLESKLVSAVYLDTESTAVYEACKHLESHGLRVLKRPAALANNDIGANDMMVYALHSIEPCDLMVQTFATTPLLSAATVDSVLTKFLDCEGHDSFFTTTKMQEYFWDGDAKALNFDPVALPNSFQLEPIFMENHCLYGIYVDALLKLKRRVGDTPKMIDIPKMESFDIDDAEDLEIVKNILIATEPKETSWS